MTLPRQGVQVRHHLPGRLRLRVTGLFHHQGLADFLTRELAGLPGVSLVQAHAHTGSLLVCFAPDRITAPRLLEAVGRTLDAERPAVPGEKTRPGGTLVPDLLAKATAGLAWYWGRWTLGLGVVALTGLSRLLSRGGTLPPALERKINLMAGLAAAGGAAVHLAGGQRTRVLAGLIAGNPLAVQAAIAATGAAAQAQLARQGVFTRQRRTLFAAGEVDTLVFTATAQLPTLQGRITQVLPVDPEYDWESVLKLLEEAHQAGHSPGDKTEPWNLNLRARLSGRDVRVGTAAYMRGARVPVKPVSHQVRRVTLTGGTPLFLAVDGAVAAIIGVEQKISPEGWRELQGLRGLGIKHIQFLTGEDVSWLNPLTVASAFEAVAGGLSPAEKAGRVGALQLQGRRVAVVGSRPEDEPALARADLPVFLGDFVPAGWNPRTESGLVTMGRLGAGRSLRNLLLEGKQLREAYLQNFLTTLGGNVAGLSLAAFGWLGPGWAFAFEGWSLAGSVYRHWRSRTTWPLHPLTRAQVSATSPSRAGLSPRPAKDGLRLAERRTGAAPSEGVVPPNWHSLAPRDVLAALAADAPNGLTAAAVRERLARYGYNELPPPRRYSWWELFREQLCDFMVQLLLAAAGISALSRRTADALTVVAIVLANAAVGVWQELRAEKSLADLQQLAPRRAMVLRDGRENDVAARELVPGDLVLLEAGFSVPADLRLLEARNLEVEESSLTGESLPVVKNAAALPAPTPLPERSGMVYAGSCVIRGRGLGVVVGTGPATEMGNIASSLADRSRGITTLQRSLSQLGKQVAYSCLAVSGLVFGLGLSHRQGVLNMFLTSLSLAVAAVPEGLVPMVTIGLGLAVYRMSRRAMVVRRLAAIETLGCVTVIGVDKTGTLTKNEMTVREVYGGGRLWLVTGEGYNPEGEFRPAGRNSLPGPEDRDDLKHLLLAGVLCNNAGLRSVPQKSKKGRPSGRAWQIQGDPTEGALLVAAAKAGLWRQARPGSPPDGFTRLAEEPFDARERQMAVMTGDPDGRRMLVVKGAPDRILQRCTRYRRDGESIPLEERVRREIAAVNENMSLRALRVLALAYKPLAASEDWRTHADLVFAGLVGMQDPPRPEVRDSLRRCREAGVAVVMITGDHPNTARAVAREIGLLDGGRVVTGDELDAMADPALDAVIDEVRVCARALPRHKLRLVKSLQRQNHVVAMAGDGVNDAPAVQQADIGLAMGLGGTDLTKGVSDMIIGDDNFATIVRGIAEGRAVYANIRHAVAYLLYTNAGDLMLMLTASVLGLPMPLVPIQLLWINLSGDGLPALAIMADPPVPGQMSRPPRPRDESILAGGLGRRIVTRGTLIGLAGFAAYGWGLSRWGLGTARTMALGSLGVSQFLHLFDPGIQVDGAGHLPPNLYKTGAGFSGLALILASIYVPALRGLFRTTPLGWRQWLPVLGTAGTIPLLNRTLDRPAGRKALGPERSFAVDPEPGR